ncbi:hypothetical protein H1R20_g15813, partial [Candolleomyces eurysporus]
MTTTTKEPLPPPESTTLTFYDKARSASISAFWIFFREITGDEKVTVPIADEVHDILPDIIYAARACAGAFKNQVRLEKKWTKIRRDTALQWDVDREDIPGSYLVVDRDGVLVAWHIMNALSPDIQKIATAAIAKFRSLAPELFKGRRIPDMTNLSVPGSDEFLDPGFIHLSPIWIYEDDSDPAPCPRPCASALNDFEHVEAYLRDFGPVACILHTIGCIINPMICIQQRTLGVSISWDGVIAELWNFTG